jgi:hypothetical protein
MPGFAQPCPQSAFGTGCDCEAPSVEECQGCGCGGGDSCSDAGFIEPCEAGLCFDDGMNLYGYVQSNPVTRVDPKGTSGLLATVISIAIGADTDTRYNLGVIPRAGMIAGFLTYWLYVHSEAIDAFIREIARTTQPREYTERQCRILQHWCNWYGLDRNCQEAMRYCINNGVWHPHHPPLPPQADPNSPPPGYKGP